VAEAGDHCAGGGAGGLVLLLDAGQDEYLVVHREAEQEGEYEDRRPEGDCAGGGYLPQRVAAVAFLPHEYQDAVGRSNGGEVQRDGLGWYQE
jgi:hypothetical protein